MPTSTAVLKSWYGCKQGPRNWYQLLYSIFTAFSTKDACWKVSDSDRGCLVFTVNGQIVMRAVTIVDDILFTVKQEHVSQYHRFVAYMKTRVHRPDDVKTWAQPTSFLNLKLTYGDGHIMISQPNFIDKLLQAANMENCKPISSFNPTGEMRFQEADCPTTEDEKAYMSKID